MTDRPFDVERYLAVLPLFSDIGAPALERIAERTQVRRLTRGEMVFHAGQPCEAFHVVVIGQVKLFVLSPAGQEKVIDVVGADKSFAEALMFLGQVSMINAQALADTLLLTVQRQTVMDEVERDPRFALRMLAGMSRRLHSLVNDVQANALQSGIQRIIGYLLRELQERGEGDAQGGVVSLAVSKATIASRLSLTPEYFSRVLRELEDAKLIEVDRRDIRILSAERLAAYPS